MTEPSHSAAPLPSGSDLGRPEDAAALPGAGDPRLSAGPHTEPAAGPHTEPAVVATAMTPDAIVVDPLAKGSGGSNEQYKRRDQRGVARRALIGQTRAEILMTLRRGESVLLALGIPIVFLGFFTLIGFPDSAATNGLDTIDFLAPGILALAIMSTAMVSLGIATGFERQYGVLKRLGATPLGRPSLLAAKTIAIAGVELVQVIVLATVAFALGWHADGDVLTVVIVSALATIAFAGLGLAMAGTLTAEVTLAAANGLYLVFLLLGGMVVPLSRLPGPVRTVAQLLPGAALSDALHAVLGSGSHVPSRAWIVLVVWALATPVAAALTFRWE